MPYIRLSMTKKLDAETEQKLVDGLGIALSKIPGKDPCWTSVEVNDGIRMYFGGEKQDNMVFLDVRYVSKFEFHLKRAFVRAAFDTVHEILGTDKERICLNITEFSNWGAAGDFRDELYIPEK